MTAHPRRSVEAPIDRQPLPFCLLIGLAAALAVPTAALILMTGFEGVYGQDSYAYYDYATGPLLDSLRSLSPLPAFHWPPGYPLVVALAVWLTVSLPVVGQMVSLVAGATVPVFTALLANEVWPTPGRRPLGPLLAGLFVAVTGQMWQSSLVVMSDTTALAAATAGVWAVARYGRPVKDDGPGPLPWLMLAASMLAFAVLTRWAMGLVAIPSTLFALSVLARRPGWKAMAHAVVAAVLVVGILSPVLAPTWQLLSGGEPDGPSFVVDLEVYRWNPLNAFRRSFVTADGRSTYRLANGVYYGLAPVRPRFFTPLIAALLLPGLWAGFRRRTPALLLLVIGWAALVLVFLVGTGWQSFRFTLTYLPPLAVLAAIGAVSLTGEAPGWFARLGPFAAACRSSRLVGLWLAAGLIWMAVAGARTTSAFISTMQANVETVTWVEARVPADAHLITFGLALTFSHESRLSTYQIFYLTEEDLAALEADGRPVYLLLEMQRVLGQWAGREPEKAYLWLRDGPGLQPVAERGIYTLFRVGGATSAS